MIERDARRRAEADGFFDAWSGYTPDPTLLNSEQYAEDYMRGYEEQRS